jgi:hypothetical protein
VILREHKELGEKLNLKVSNMENALERIRSERQKLNYNPQN